MAGFFDRIELRSGIEVEKYTEIPPPNSELLAEIIRKSLRPAIVSLLLFGALALDKCHPVIGSR
jgi:hypothetical protein